MPSRSRSPKTSAPAPFGDLAGFIELPRVTALAVRPDGKRVVAAVQQPDEKGARYVSALWEIDPDGTAAPRRLTFSKKGESAPRFARDGTLLFSSARPDPQNDDASDAPAALWALPERGEAAVLASAPGGLSLEDIARDGRMLASTDVLAGGTLENDDERRQRRKDTAVTAILHTGMPIRHWDHELDDTSPRLVLVDADGRLTDLAPAAGTALTNASATLSDDGAAVLTTWRWPGRRGQTEQGLVLVDTARRRRRTLLREKSATFDGPVFAPDGRRFAVVRTTVETFDDPGEYALQLRSLDDDTVVTAELGDLTPGEYLFSPNGRTLYVSGDLHSRGAILAVDTTTGASRPLVDDACYSQLHVTSDGSRMFALRSSITEPPAPVRLALDAARETPLTPVRLPAPGATGPLPGHIARLEVPLPTASGAPGDAPGTAPQTTVGAWLCTPAGASEEHPAPLMVWVHGGPFGSWNSWSWRWNPWLAVARGYAVLLPDPAMSTGYGYAGLKRGWPRNPAVVWAEVEALTDETIARADIDGERTALLGGSFGGFMTNWIAGQTDRFKAIVTHAGLWALDQQHATTDAAAHKTAVHGRLEERPEWYAAYSPHNAVANIRTPLLVIHGNRDYRVPVSEALRLWWELVSAFPGSPDAMPHRFLQFTSENHWVLAPGNARVWYESVFAFCDQHVLGGPPMPDTVIEW